ncbi:MAG: PriCT-2 protein, partial [Campylobacterota bacterium]|nr:PriCT-2 protein [Campylobacterota bacterium]
LITEAITKTSNRVHDVSKIENFSFETLNYSDFSLSVKSFGKSNITHADKKREAYAGLEKLIGAEDTDKIFSIIENIKVDLAEKKKSGFWKENPFNKITNLTLEWSEGSSDTNVQFKSFAELNDWFDKTFRFADDIPGVNEGYVKNKISFSMINDAGETFNTSVRADVSASSGDFNPRRGNIYSYFADKLKYNLDTPRAMANGSSVYVDLSRYKDNAVAFGDEEQKNLFQFTFYNKWDTTIYKQVESWGATQEEAYSSIVAADSHGDEYEGLEDLEYSVEKLDIGVSDIKREFNIAESLDEDGDALYTIGKSDFKISSNSDGIPDMLQAMFEHAKNSEEVVSWISSRELSSTIVDSRGNGFVVSDIADFLDREHERFLQSSAVRSLAAGANSDLAGGEVERLANSGRVNKDLV